MRWVSFRKAQEANKRTQAWMLNHTLQPLEVSAWPDDLRQALERGLFCPLDWMTPRTSPTWGTSRRSTSPTSGGLREAQNPWNQEALLATPAPPKGATGRGRDQPVPPQNLDTEEGKLSLLLWAMKRHQGELRMFGGIWKKHSSGEIPKRADQQFKLSPEELLALERRTHPLTCERDHIDLEIRAQVNRGERPAPEQVVGIFWAKGDGVFWTRQTRTWDLPSLTGVYAHRFTFKYIYSAWATSPLVVKTQRRGRNAEGSASDKWMGNILQMRKEAVPFLESLGIPKPRSKAEWSYIFKEMGTFLAAKNFIVNCPLPVMELPVAPVHDSKEALRFRAVCDERITLPLSSLRAFDSVYTKLVAGLSKSSMAEIKVNWRCNVVHDWVEPVPQEAAGPCTTVWATPRT